MKHLFVMDPVETIRIDRDSTFALMCEAERRGHAVAIAYVEDLWVEGGEAFARARWSRFQRVQGSHVMAGEPGELSLDGFDVIWMRKDPPFHMGYIFNTYVLDLAVARGRLVVNAPAGLRNMNEKAWAMRFPELTPRSLVTQSMARLRAFADAHGHVVIKPLDGNGGEGVFVVRRDDPNIGVIIETVTQHGQRKVLSQVYVPEIREGDKRVILVDGEPVGAILRVPQGIDHRGNIHVGAKVVRAELTGRDREICAAIGPALREAGQVFVGIDVIGRYLTEVNVTSPTGIHEINAFEGISIEAMVLDAVERRLAGAPA